MPKKLTVDEALVMITGLAVSAKIADQNRFDAQLRLGALVARLQSIYRRCDRLEGVRPIKDVLDQDFELDYSRGVQFAKFYEVNRALGKKMVGKLRRESHARVVAPLLDDPALLVGVVKRAYSRVSNLNMLTARHLEAARRELAPDSYAEHAPDDADASEAPAGPADSPDDAERDRALAEAAAQLDALGVPAPADGLHVAVPGPTGLDVRPWDDGAPAPEVTVVDRSGLAPIRLDPVAEHAWLVAVPGVREVADAWALPDGPFRATYVPARLGAVAEPAPPPRDRSRVVLVAPGVDIFDEGVSDEVVHQIAQAMAADPTRLYLLLTRRPGRAAAAGLPANAVVVVGAGSPGAAVDLARDVGAASGATDAALALLLRDAHGPVPEGFGAALGAFDWVLVRGGRTSWETLEAVYAAVPSDRVHVAREVRARPEAHPLLGRLADAPAPAPRRAVPVRGRPPARRPPARRTSASTS